MKCTHLDGIRDDIPENAICEDCYHLNDEGNPCRHEIENRPLTDEEILEKMDINFFPITCLRLARESERQIIFNKGMNVIKEIDKTRKEKGLGK